MCPQTHMYAVVFVVCPKSRFELWSHQCSVCVSFIYVFTSVFTYIVLRVNVQVTYTQGCIQLLPLPLSLSERPILDKLTKKTEIPSDLSQTAS